MSPAVVVLSAVLRRTLVLQCNAGQRTASLIITGEDCNFEEQTIIAMDISSYIEIRPEIMMGKPVIKGTRITVEMILESLGAGETVDNLLKSYPRLTKEAISAALFFAVEALKTERIYPIAV